MRKLDSCRASSHDKGRDRRRERGESDADGNCTERLRFAVRKRSFVNLAANAVSNYAGLLQISLRQQDGKLFAAITRGDVHFAERGSQALGGNFQRAVAGLVAVLIVVDLEVVNIDHHKAKRIIIALGSA